MGMAERAYPRLKNRVLPFLNKQTALESNGAAVGEGPNLGRRVVLYMKGERADPTAFERSLGRKYITLLNEEGKRLGEQLKPDAVRSASNRLVRFRGEYGRNDPDSTDVKMAHDLLHRGMMSDAKRTGTSK